MNGMLHFTVNMMDVVRASGITCDVKHFCLPFRPLKYAHRIRMERVVILHHMLDN